MTVSSALQAGTLVTSGVSADSQLIGSLLLLNRLGENFGCSVAGMPAKSTLMKKSI